MERQERVTSGNHWAQVAAALDEAHRYIAGWSSRELGDTPGQDAIFKRLLDAEYAADAMASARQISLDEAELTKQVLRGLHHDVRVNPHVTCYMATHSGWQDASLDNLRNRLPLLEKVVAGKRVHPEVARAALTAIERDLSYLEGQTERTYDPKLAAELTVRTRAKVEQLRRRLAAADAKQSPRHPDAGRSHGE